MAQSSFSKLGSLELGLFVVQLRLRAKSPISFGQHEAANLLRGQFGRMLHEDKPEIYGQLFQPASGKPSGLQDAPRPYVLRTRDLDGRSFSAGEEIPFRVHIFREADWPEMNRVILNLTAPSQAVSRVKVEFLTPTELKGVDGVDFGGLFARLRDRVSGLRGLYGGGALELDFKGMGERARQVKTVSVSVADVRRERISRNTGFRHSIGGFVGEAIYEGDLGEFLPYLEAGSWVGVGRHTVWGNGELRVSRCDA